MNSPSQKDSGIDDSSPLSYDDPGEHVQTKVFESMDTDHSHMPLKHAVVDSSTDGNQYLQVDNHNATVHSPCETCVNNDATQSTRVGDESTLKSTDLDVSGEDSSVILIDDDVDFDSKRAHNSLKQNAGSDKTNAGEFSSRRGKRYHCDSLSGADSGQEVAITSTTSPDKDFLLKAAGLLTNPVSNQSSLSKKGVSSKKEGIFDLFSVNNGETLADDLIQDKSMIDTMVGENICDSTQSDSKLASSSRPDLFSMFSSVRKLSGGDESVSSSKAESPDHKSHTEVLGRNIFEVLAQETSLQSPDKKPPRKKSKTSSSATSPRAKSNESIVSSQTSRTDFESATGESQFNFYNANDTAIKDTVLDSSGVVYKDCYIAEEGHSQNTCSSLQSDNNECYSLGDGDQTPSKYAFLSQDSGHINDVLSLSDVPVADKSLSQEVAKLDYQCEFTKFLNTKEEREVTPAKSQNLSNLSSPDNEKVRGHLEGGQKWTMSSRQIRGFQNNHQRIVLLRRKVCKFLRLVFPFLQYPTYFKTHAMCVDNLLDQLTNILDGSNVKCHSPHAIPHELTCCEVQVVVCKSPRQCLNYLRRKIIRFLQAVLPEMKISPSFDTSSEMVETLLQQIIICNQSHEKSS